MIFAELLWGLAEHTTKIYGAYEDIFDDNMLKMCELFINSLPKPKKKLKEVKTYLPNQISIKRTKVNINQEDANKAKEL